MLLVSIASILYRNDRSTVNRFTLFFSEDIHVAVGDMVDRDYVETPPYMAGGDRVVLDYVDALLQLGG